MMMELAVGDTITPAAEGISFERFRGFVKEYHMTFVPGALA